MANHPPSPPPPAPSQPAGLGLPFSSPPAPTPSPHSSSSNNHTRDAPTAAHSPLYPSWLPARPEGPQPDSAYTSYAPPRPAPAAQPQPTPRLTTAQVPEPSVAELLRAEEPASPTRRVGEGERVRVVKGKERQAAPRPVQVVAGPGEPSTSAPRDTRVSFPSVPFPSHSPPLRVPPVQYHAPSPTSPFAPSPSAASSAPSADSSPSTSFLPRPLPVYKHPSFAPSLLHDPTLLARLHFRLLPLLTFAHLPLQIFLDINALYILVLAASYPDASAPGVPGSGKNWALGTAAYAICAFCQYALVFVLYELIISFFRRWRHSRPPILPIYLSRSASALLSLTSFAHFSFINQIRRSAWKSRSPRCPGGWRDGIAETAWLYAQNGWTVLTLLPRAALALALLLAFWNVQPGGEVFGEGGMDEGRDGLYFVSGQGNLTAYAKGVLIANAAWTLWRTLILLLSWLALWLLSQSLFAGLFGPRNAYEESGGPARAYVKRGVEKQWAGEKEVDGLVWAWRERTRERVREAWEFCLVDREGRRLSRGSGSRSGASKEKRSSKPLGPVAVTLPAPPPVSVPLPATTSQLPPPPLSQPPALQPPASQPQRRSILSSELFAPPQSHSGPSTGALSGSGEPTITLPTPPLPTAVVGREKEEELAKRVQRILKDWVDPDEDYGVFDPARPSGSFSEDDRAFEEELARQQRTGTYTPGVGVGEGEFEGLGRAEEGSASMSSLGKPVGQGLGGEWRRTRSSLAPTGTGTGSGHTPSNSLSQGSAPPASAPPSAAAAVQHSHTSSMDSADVSDPGVPMLATRAFVPHLPPPPPAAAPSSSRRRAPFAGGTGSSSSPTSVAEVFSRTRTTSGHDTTIHPLPETERRVSEESMLSSHASEGEDSVGLLGGGPSRQTSIDRLRRRVGSFGSRSRERSRSGSLSSVGQAVAMALRRTRTGSGSSSGPPAAHSRGRAEPRGSGQSFYADARSYVPSSDADESAEGDEEEEEEEEPIVDGTFGRQSDWLAELEGDRTGAGQVPGSPSLTIQARRSLPSGSLRGSVRGAPESLSASVPQPIPIRQPPSAYAVARHSRSRAERSRAGDTSASAGGESFVTAPSGGVTETDEGTGEGPWTPYSVGVWGETLRGGRGATQRGPGLGQ